MDPKWREFRLIESINIEKKEYFQLFYYLFEDLHILWNFLYEIIIPSFIKILSSEEINNCIFMFGNKWSKNVWHLHFIELIISFIKISIKIQSIDDKIKIWTTIPFRYQYIYP